MPKSELDKLNNLKKINAIKHEKDKYFKEAREKQIADE